VGVAIAFTVPVIGLSVGYKVGQFLQQVMADIRIGILIDGHSGSCVGHKDRDRTYRHSMRRNNLPNLVRNIHQLAPRFRHNLNRIHPLPFASFRASVQTLRIPDQCESVKISGEVFSSTTQVTL
jgi:hypothetical protein